MPGFWSQFHNLGPEADAEDRIARLTLVCEALGSLLKERVGITEEEIADRVNQIDLTDGQLDGRVRHAARTCRHCNRNVSPRFAKCIYCGQAV